MSGQFHGKVVLVTGGSAGIGQTTALAFAGAGARVVIANRSVAGGEETVRMITAVGGEAVFIRTDVSQAAQVEALIAGAVDTYGRLDCAFNNAGYEGLRVSTADLPEADWERALGTNLSGSIVLQTGRRGTMMKREPSTTSCIDKGAQRWCMIFVCTH